MLPFLRDLMAHAEWANAVFFHAWEKSPARDHEELRRRLNDLAAVQHGFLSILSAYPPGRPRRGRGRVNLQSAAPDGRQPRGTS
jgi:hypothetical protein